MTRLYTSKQDPSIFTPLARRVAALIIPYVPAWVRPNQITLLGFGLGVAVGLCFYLASFWRGWLVVASVCLVAHWVSDNLDGELARARQQTSRRGFFLDLYLDNVNVAAIGLGLAFASYTVFEIVITVSILGLLGAMVILFRIMLTQQFPMPRVGPAELRFGMIVLATLTFFFPQGLLEVAGRSLGWFDVACLLLLPLCVLEVGAGAYRLAMDLETA